jgi:hypothetical protein
MVKHPDTGRDKDPCWEQRVWAAVAALIVVGLAAYRVLTAGRALVYRHAGLTADLALWAENYAREGLLRHAGLMQWNRPPLDGIPAAYTHWPPLGAWLLAGWGRVFGFSEAALHLYALVWQMAACALVYLLARRQMERWQALTAAAVYAALPGRRAGRRCWRG